MDELMKYPPKMKTGDSLLSALRVLPPYDETIRFRGEAERLIALSDLFQIYIPSQMSMEIYSKLYLALLRSLQKKTTKTTILQYNENHKAIQKQDYNSVLGGSDSFTIIGTSGIGKSSAINRAIELLCESGMIESEKPHTKIIPCVVVQCPFDASVKGLLLEILRKVDEEIGSDYYKKSLKIRATTDMLIGCVSQVAINHIGLLVVDEIQNVVGNAHGNNLVAMLTQLINNSGISICMVGTPESTAFFEGAMQLARRSLGLQYQSLEYDSYFHNFCHTLFAYQYTKQKTEITDTIVRWLYEHSGGIVSVVVLLIHDAQEIAIITGKEVLNLETLNEAYKKRLTLLHNYIAPSIKQGKQTSARQKRKIPLPEKESKENESLISDLVSRSKGADRNIVSFLKQQITVEEVQI